MRRNTASPIAPYGPAIVEPASITIPLLGANLDENDMVSTPSVAASIQGAIMVLYQGPQAG